MNASEMNQIDGEPPVENEEDEQIVPGILLSSTGHATVDPALADVLFDLALELEEPTKLPVDIEHVLGAIVLAVRHGDIDSITPLSSSDSALVSALARHVQAIFSDHGGELGRDE